MANLLHKFVDGLAIGVNFGLGWQPGLSSSIAILCHEIPHVLGDFVLYKKFGLSNNVALGVNLIEAVISFGGLYVGTFLGSATLAATWILALVAGLFIYVSLVDVVSKIKFNPVVATRSLIFEFGPESAF